MQSTLKTLILAAFLPLALQLSAQEVNVHIVCEGQTLQFTPESEYWGEPSWEYSPDSLNWESLDLPENQLYEMQPEQTGYYRLRVYDSECDAAYYSVGLFVAVAERVPVLFINSAFSSMLIPSESDPLFWVSGPDELYEVVFHVDDMAFSSDSISKIIDNPGENFSIYATARSGDLCLISDTLHYTVFQTNLNAPGVININGSFDLSNIIVQSSIDSIALQGSSNFDLDFSIEYETELIMASRVNAETDTQIVALYVARYDTEIITLSNENTALAFILMFPGMGVYAHSFYHEIIDYTSSHPLYSSFIQSIDNQLMELGYLDVNYDGFLDSYSSLGSDVLEEIENLWDGSRSGVNFPLLETVLFGNVQSLTIGNTYLGYTVRAYNNEGVPISPVFLFEGFQPFTVESWATQAMYNKYVSAWGSSLTLSLIKIIEPGSGIQFSDLTLQNSQDMQEITFRVTHGFETGNLEEQVAHNYNSFLKTRAWIGLMSITGKLLIEKILLANSLTGCTGSLVGTAAGLLFDHILLPVDATDEEIEAVWISAGNSATLAFLQCFVLSTLQMSAAAKAVILAKYISLGYIAVVTGATAGFITRMMADQRRRENPVTFEKLVIWNKIIDRVELSKWPASVEVTPTFEGGSSFEMGFALLNSGTKGLDATGVLIFESIPEPLTYFLGTIPLNILEQFSIQVEAGSYVEEVTFDWPSLEVSTFTNPNPGEPFSFTLEEVGTGECAITLIAATELSTDTLTLTLLYNNQPVTMEGLDENGQWSYLVNIEASTQPPYPPGTVHCLPGGAPTEVVEVTNPVTGRTWMDRNLGAAQVATSPTDEEAFGDLYQWGRFSDGHQCRNSPSSSDVSLNHQPNNNYFYNSNYNFNWIDEDFIWNNWSVSAFLWSTLNSVNNPCPLGFRLPSFGEWESELDSWQSYDLNGSFGNNPFDSPLKLPLGGRRLPGASIIEQEGISGRYWSSTSTEEDASGEGAAYLGIFQNQVYVGINFPQGRAMGLSVRCIKD